VNAFSGAAFGVFADSRARRWRRRSRVVGSALILGFLAAGLAYFASGGGGHRAPAQGVGTTQSGTVFRGGDLVLYGHRAFTFEVHAPVGLAYDVRFTAPAASRAVVTMKIARGAGWTFSTRDDPPCRTSAGRTGCLLHFAGGGNPGGVWWADVRNTTASTAALQLVIAFFKPSRSATS
jgi:hypothetical protein